MPVSHLQRPATALAAVLLAAAFPARAELALGTVAGSDIVFEGLLQADWHRYGGHWSGSEHDMRRAELVLKGKGPGDFDWVVGYDAHSEKWLDVNGRFRFADGAQSLQLGQFKQPNSMEELGSTRGNDFISKAAATNTFAVARRLGVGWSIDRGDWSLTASRFDRELTRGQGEGAGLGARATWAPLRNDGQVLHLGLSWARLDAPDAGGRLRARPNADLSDIRVVDTGLLDDARRQRTLGAEALWIRGPVKLQAEWFGATLAREAGPDFDAGGGYASALWNLTGQTWSYRAGVPGTPIGGAGNRGLWQLGLRYDRLDLDDFHLAAGSTEVAGVAGGTMDAWTVGVNWYWRDHVKLALNHVAVSSRRYDASAGGYLHDDPDITELRVQLHW